MLMKTSLFLGLSVALVSLIMFLGMFSITQARTVPMNSMELMQRVMDNNMGWDYVPQCNSETHWDMDDRRCEQGKSDGDSYGIMNAAHLMQKVHEVNRGWDWVPSCGGKAQWDDDEERCKGGTG